MMLSAAGGFLKVVVKGKCFIYSFSTHVPLFFFGFKVGHHHFSYLNRSQHNFLTLYSSASNAVPFKDVTVRDLYEL